MQTRNSTRAPSDTPESPNYPAPAGPWTRTWILAIALVVAFLSIWEGYWRSRGFLPSLDVSYYELWGRARREVEPTSIVLIGTSRIESGLNPEIVSRITGRKAIQLGINGASPVAVLEHFAEDEHYRGLVVCDLVPRIAFDASGEREQRSEEAIAAYRRLPSPADRSEGILTTFTNARLAFRNPALAARSLLSTLGRGEMPKVPYYSIDENRFRSMDFTAPTVNPTDRETGLLKGVSTQGRPANDAEFEVIVGRVEAAVSRIRARGGEVVFVQFPSSRRILEAEEQRYPRARYWDALAKRTQALMLHFKDHPELESFDCPDGSHLDQRDTAAFSEALSKVLVNALKARGTMAQR